MLTQRSQVCKCLLKSKMEVYILYKRGWSDQRTRSRNRRGGAIFKISCVISLILLAIHVGSKWCQHLMWMVCLHMCIEIWLWIKSHKHLRKVYFFISLISFKLCKRECTASWGKTINMLINRMLIYKYCINDWKR
jgi:hypothetical protein